MLDDVLDKETKQFLLIFAGIMIFLLFVYPRISADITSADFSKQLVPITQSGDITNSGSANKITIDKTKNYTATVETSEGDFDIDLFEETAPANVSNFVNQIRSYQSAPVRSQSGFLFKVDAKNDTTQTTKDEINADYLGLNDKKVRDALFLKDLYDPNDKSTSNFSPENLDKYSDFTVKQFYTEILKYKYDAKLTTPKAVKYMVFMANSGPDTNRTDFFVLMSNSAPQVDGRYTPIGQVSKGFDVLDKLDTASSTSVSKVKISTE